MKSNGKLCPLGKLVVKALADQEKTKSQLAAEIGTSPQYLSYILYGVRSGEKYLPALIAALKLDPGRSRRQRQHDSRKGGTGVPDVFITMKEAAEFEGVKYGTFAQRIARNPKQYKTKTQPQEGGGKEQVLIAVSSLSQKAGRRGGRRRKWTGGMSS